MADDRPAIRTQDGLPPCETLSAGEAPVELELEPGVYSWCSCGHSKQQPFCDGTHKEPACPTNRRSLKFELTARQSVRLCLCKRTTTAPYCSGAHEQK
jgi:CDGSH iron-sulfur domain-containing protein 3